MAEDEFFLSRWSRRKVLARRGEPAPEPAPPLAPAAAGVAAPAVPAAAEPPPLPPVETLTPDSDFSPFMRAEVDPNLRRTALRTLFQDPRFNVMDGLDVYIDDYSKPDPIPAEWMGRLNQMARLGDYQEPEAEAQAEASGAQAEADPAAGEPAPQDAAATLHPEREAPESDTCIAGKDAAEVEDPSVFTDASDVSSGVRSTDNY